MLTFFSLSYLLLIIIIFIIYIHILFYPMILHAKRKIKNHANYSTTFIPACIYNLHPVWQLLIHLPRSETAGGKVLVLFSSLCRHRLQCRCCRCRRGVLSTSVFRCKNTGTFTINVITSRILAFKL